MECSERLGHGNCDVHQWIDGSAQGGRTHPSEHRPGTNITFTVLQYVKVVDNDIDIKEVESIRTDNGDVSTLASVRRMTRLRTTRLRPKNLRPMSLRTARSLRTASSTTGFQRM